MKVSFKFSINLDNFPRVMGEKINFARRDIAEFTPYGYSTEKLGELETRLNAFVEFPTDEEFEGDVMIASEEKNSKQEEIKDEIGKVMLRVQNKYGQRSAHYKKFGANSLSKMTDSRLLRAARRVVRVAGMYLQELQGQGLDAAQIDALKVLANEFDAAMDKQDDAVADREIGTFVRTNTANELYAEVARLCDTGKTIWRRKNEAKYNDYVIYDTPSGKPEAEELVAQEGDGVLS